MRNEIPTTQNEEWGFWGTMRHEGCQEETWEQAIIAVSSILWCEYEDARLVLDSTVGRHIADTVRAYIHISGLPPIDALNAALRRWMGNENCDGLSMLEEQAARVFEYAAAN